MKEISFNAWARVRVVDHFSDLYMREGLITGGVGGRVNVTIDGAIHSLNPGSLILAQVQEEN